jgi:hypothetical protein
MCHLELIFDFLKNENSFILLNCYHFQIFNLLFQLSRCFYYLYFIIQINYLNQILASQYFINLNLIII